MNHGGLSIRSSGRTPRRVLAVAALNSRSTALGTTRTSRRSNLLHPILRDHRRWTCGFSHAFRHEPSSESTSWPVLSDRLRSQRPGTDRMNDARRHLVLFRRRSHRIAIARFVERSGPTSIVKSGRASVVSTPIDGIRQSMTNIDQRKGPAVRATRTDLATATTLAWHSLEPDGAVRPGGSVQFLGAEPGDHVGEAFAQVDFGFPTQCGRGEGEVGLALHGVADALGWHGNDHDLRR